MTSDFCELFLGAGRGAFQVIRSHIEAFGDNGLFHFFKAVFTPSGQNGSGLNLGNVRYVFPY